jgi:hypothetical protein
MNREVGGLNENIGPNAGHQILIADQLSVAFKQSNQDFQSATSERWACRLPAKGTAFEGGETVRTKLLLALRWLVRFVS